MGATASALDAGDALSEALTEIDVLRKALAERDAGEAERTALAVARERDRWMRYARHPVGCARDGDRPCDCGLDAARATSPAPEASPARAAVERLAALLDEAVVALTDASETIDEADELMMRERLLDDEDVDVSQAVSARCLALGNRITEALAAARKGGG